MVAKCLIGLERGVEESSMRVNFNKDLYKATVLLRENYQRVVRGRLLRIVSNYSSWNR